MISRLLILLILVGLTGSVQAANQLVRDLYRFEQPVADAGVEARSAALRDAMATVLIRVSGDRTIDQRPGAQRLLLQANGFVQQYAYVQRPAPAATITVSPDTLDAEPLLVLQGRFAKRALSAAMRKAGLPLWSEQRPRTLAVIAVDAPGGGYLLDDVTAAAYPEIAEIAQARGLPLLLPAAESLRFEDAWTRSETALHLAATAQQVDYVFWARLQESSGKWLLQAELHPHPPLAPAPVSEEPLMMEQLQAPQAAASPPLQEWLLRSREPGLVLREALQRTVDYIAAQHALAGTQPGGESIVGLWVRGLKSGADYMRVQKHLESLPVIEKLDLVAVREGALVFRVSTESSPEQLDQSIRRAGRLQTDAQPPSVAESPIWTGEFEFHYRLR